MEPLATGHQLLARITRLTATGTRQHLADGDGRLECLSAEVAGHRLAWTERGLLVRSRQLAGGRRRCPPDWPGYGRR